MGYIYQRNLKSLSKFADIVCQVIKGFSVLNLDLRIDLQFT